jgi:hypothetical protein
MGDLIQLPTLTLRRGTTAWTYNFAQRRGAEAVRRAFGTTVVPTPFTSEAPVERVIAAVRKRNPGHLIRVIAPHHKTVA